MYTFFFFNRRRKLKQQVSFVNQKTLVEILPKTHISFCFSKTYFLKLYYFSEFLLNIKPYINHIIESRTSFFDAKKKTFAFQFFFNFNNKNVSWFSFRCKYLTNCSKKIISAPSSLGSFSLFVDCSFD